MDDNYNTNNNFNENNQNSYNNQSEQGSQSNTQQGDSFYSYNRGSESGQNTYSSQSTGNTYGNNSYANNSYGSNSYGSTNNSYYGNNAGSTNGGQYYQNAAYGNGSKPQKKKKERKPGGFGKQVAKCAALALVFGLVAGGVMTGVNYGAGKVLGTAKGTGTQAALTTSDGTGIKSTAVSSTYAATDVSDIVDAVMPSIVAITNVSQTEYQSFWGQPQTYESTSCGSGIIVSQDENYLYIATNNHVVDGESSLTVTFANDDTVSAEVKGTDPSTDLAVVKVDLSSISADTMSAIKVATLGDSDNLKVGESSIAIGNALGYGQSVTTGVISALNRQVSVSESSSNTNYTAELIQTDAAINPGNSGGALLNMKGEVIGINSSKYSDTTVEGMGYAIPITAVQDRLDDLMNRQTREKVDESEKGYLGISCATVSSDVSEAYGIPEGVLVTDVASKSAAEKAGIKANYVITKIDGQSISSAEELTEKLNYYAVGETVPITYEYLKDDAYVEKTVDVTLMENPNANNK